VKDIDTSLETLSKELLDAYSALCPTSRTRKKTKPPRRNLELTLKRNSLQEFLKIAKKANSEIINEEYQILIRDYKKESRRAQRSSCRNFCFSIENVPETARLRRLLSKQPTIQSQLKRDDGQWTEGSEEALTALMQSHFPGCTDVLDARTHKDTASGEARSTNDLVTPSKMNWAIDLFAGYKAPGLDGVFPAVLKVTKKRITPWLYEIYSASLY